MTLQLSARAYTADEYEKLVADGVLAEDDRVELINGRIVALMTIGPRHAAGVRRLIRLLSPLLDESIDLDVQNPVRLDDYSEPQPDLTLLRRVPDAYASGHPRPPAVVLLVEVADTSLEIDREVKVPLYARSGVPEVWLVDLDGDVILTYRDPSPDGYRTVLTRRRGEWLGPEAFPGREIAVDDILG